MRRSTRLANDAWESLLQAHATLIKRFLEEDDWNDVSMREYDVLYSLAKAGDPIRLGDLQRHVLLSQPALSRMVDRLVTRGLVQRETDPTDARGVLLSLTTEGRYTQRRVGRSHARSVAATITGRLDYDEMARLEELCLRLAEDHSSQESERT